MRQFNPSLRVDQVDEYWTSSHGQRLRNFDDPGVATCIDCHTAHDIRSPDDPQSSVYAGNVVDLCSSCHSDGGRMAGRDMPTDQAESYSSSVHGRMLLEDGDVSAPVCNDCHGNHGAAPPGLASVRNVCGQCHTVMADYFDQSAHGEIFEEEDLPGCSLCHGHHAVESVSDETLVERSTDVCLNCHAESDPEGGAFAAMARLLDSLEAEVEVSRLALEDAESRGMEVGQAFFELEDVNNVRARARSAVHTFSAEPVREEVEAGMSIAERAQERATDALDEYEFRRIGLGLSSLIIVLLIVSILMKAGELERAEKP
jgi:predicted CXXCH cytochrome family protein